MTTSIDTLLSEIYDLGWYLYQLRDDPDGRYDHWSCTIRLEAGAASLASFGQGPTPTIALSMAIDQIPGAVAHQIPRPAVVSHPPPYSPAAAAPARTLASILATRRPATVITRRI